MGKEKETKPVKRRISKKITLQEKEQYIDKANRIGYKVALDIPYVPTSINNLYFNNRFSGGRSLTTEGKVFKRRVIEHITNNYLPELMKFNRRSMFSIKIVVFLPIDLLFSKTYLIDKKIKSPYRKRDIGNMEKVIIDCIKDFCMEDDCQIFSETLEKRIVDSNTHQGIIVIIEEIFPIMISNDPTCFEEHIDLCYKLRRYQHEDNQVH